MAPKNVISKKKDKIVKKEVTEMETDIFAFLKHHHITNDQGVELDFKDHPFMIDIYRDWSPRIVGRKAAQVTWSTAFNIKALYAAKYFGLDIIYSLPSDANMKDFVSGKTNRIIDSNPIFQQWTEDKDSIEQKKVGKNIIYYRGAWTTRSALSTPADLYICDEKDRSNPEIVSQYSSRLQHSKFAWEWEFSNPSMPGVGCDVSWQKSDQKHWFVMCECGYEWYMTMENIVTVDGKSYFGCTKCKRELDRRKGRWVKKYPNREISGWWVSLLMCSWVSADKIVEMKETKTEQYFANFVLGEPYVGKGNVLTKNLLFQNLIDRINPQDSQPIIGVDTSVDISYVVGNKYGIFFFGECQNYSDLEKLLKRWPTAIMMMDQKRDIIGSKELREKYPNRVFLCFYRSDKKSDELIEFNEMENTVMIDRNRCIQLVVDEFTDKRIPLFGKEEEWINYWNDWSHIYRSEEKGRDQVTISYNWISSDRIAFVNATVYFRVGLSRFDDSTVVFAEPNVKIGSIGYEELPEGGAKIMGLF